MGEPDDPSLFRSVKSKATPLDLGRDSDTSPVPPTQLPAISHAAHTAENDTDAANVAEKSSSNASGGEAPAAIDVKLPMPTRMKNGSIRFLEHTKDALFYSWINVLLVFVPMGIAVHLAHLSPEIIFAMNAVAIVPLAGLLAHATEAVAARLGDTLGALLNVSFGNAVELILFIILLADNQIGVVQAALLGSILANLLLILGMAFLLGGLRYQEQVYNSTVTQMSACMLSLAVMSLLLPTAFHAAFSDYQIADKETLYVSRGTSVVLLLVYVLYLVFQLKSHTYMYASTPQHVIDEESHPGVLHDVFDSSSSDSSSSSSDSESDSSAGSHLTAAKKIKRAIKRTRRKSTASSKDSPLAPSVISSPSVENHKNHLESQRSGAADADNDNAHNASSISHPDLHDIQSGDEADTDEHMNAPVVRDFEAGSSASVASIKLDKSTSKHKRKHRNHGRSHRHVAAQSSSGPVHKPADNTHKVAFANHVHEGEATLTPKRSLRPGLPSLLSNNVFINPQNPPPHGAAISNVRIAGPRDLRRTKSLPDNINRAQTQPNVGHHPALSRQSSGSPATVPEPIDEEEHAPIMSRTAAVVMLLVSTGLVAVCADFLSESIEPMVEKTNVSQAFIGLIILPIVGNAAEHVTAVTVAAKNKMDLSIGIAVGSSIQIAIFITPLIVILGWIMDKSMSLYFNIFETVALFVTAFVVNFLVLDGRSNYLEGSLLIAAYVIIALSSFFYPDGCAASQIGGSENGCG